MNLKQTVSSYSLIIYLGFYHWSGNPCVHTISASISIHFIMVCMLLDTIICACLLVLFLSSVLQLFTEKFSSSMHSRLCYVGNQKQGTNLELKYICIKTGIPNKKLSSTVTIIALSSHVCYIAYTPQSLL